MRRYERHARGERQGGGDMTGRRRRKCSWAEIAGRENEAYQDPCVFVHLSVCVCVKCACRCVCSCTHTYTHTPSARSYSVLVECEWKKREKKKVTKKCEPIIPHRQGEVQNLHNAFGHPNNQAFLQHCQHAKIGTKYLFKTTVLSTGGVLMNS